MTLLKLIDYGCPKQNAGEMRFAVAKSKLSLVRMLSGQFATLSRDEI
jgi:hypothetical protein